MSWEGGSLAKAREGGRTGQENGLSNGVVSVGDLPQPDPTWLCVCVISTPELITLQDKRTGLLYPHVSHWLCCGLPQGEGRHNLLTGALRKKAAIGL